MSDERLSGYLLGELDPEERAAFEAELRDDPRLRAEAERLMPLVARLEGLEPAAWEQPPEPPALPDLGRAAPQRAARAPWWRRSFALRPLPAAALASVLLALGVAAGLLFGDGDGGGGRSPRGTSWSSPRSRGRTRAPRAPRRSPPPTTAPRCGCAGCRRASPASSTSSGCSTPSTTWSRSGPSASRRRGRST